MFLTSFSFVLLLLSSNVGKDFGRRGLVCLLTWGVVVLDKEGVVAVG